MCLYNILCWKESEQVHTHTHTHTHKNQRPCVLKSSSVFLWRHVFTEGGQTWLAANRCGGVNGIQTQMHTHNDLSHIVSFSNYFLHSGCHEKTWKSMEGENSNTCTVRSSVQIDMKTSIVVHFIFLNTYFFVKPHCSSFIWMKSTLKKFHIDLLFEF